jgi:sugar phosphate isomerase/epimerase
MSWRIGASTGSCHQRPIIDVIHALADVRIGALEIGTPPGHFDMWQRSQVAAVREALTATGTRAVAIHAPFGGLLDLSDPNPHHRNAGLGAILTAAAVLKELGGRVVVAHATDVARSVGDADVRMQHACSSIRGLQTACAELGMTLAIESPLPHLIGGMPAEFARLLQAAGPDASVCLDTGHLSLGRHWDAFVELAAQRVVHVHAHDNAGIFDDHKPPGEGMIDWSRIATSLRRLAFDGWIMLELACPTEPLGRHFARSEERLRALLGDSPQSTENLAQVAGGTGEPAGQDR